MTNRFAPHLRENHPRHNGYVDLRDYGAIGDGRTVALVATDGSIDWLPMPDLTSPPVFARLLDAADGGYVELRPVEDFEMRRRYIPGTNVLETTFSTASGSVCVTDAFVTGVAGRLPWSELARRVDGLTGTVEMRWAVVPGTALSSASPWVQATANGTVLHVDGVMLSLVGVDHGPDEPGEQELHGGFVTSAGSRHLLGLSATDHEPLRVLTPDLVDRTIDSTIDRTIDSEKFWSKEFSFEGRWEDPVRHSALALKLLIHSPNGSIAAAATSLPERLQGGKNWDYRFAWVRDLVYTVHALIRFGLREETHAAVSWILRTLREYSPDLRVFYTLGGEIADEAYSPDVPGWRGIGPVRVGNAAQKQVQLGIYGDLFDVVLAYVRDGNVLDADTARMLAGFADDACDRWMRTDAGIWELEDQQHYTSSKLGCWQALDCAVQLSALGQIPGDSTRWEADRDRIRTWVELHCWSENRQSYTWYPGTDALDTSVLLHAPSGFDRGARMSSTIDALQAELGRGPLLYRYSGMECEEGTFTPSAFWLAGALARVGREEEAIARLNELIDLGNDLGLYSEMMDAETGDFLGNLPQGLSHLALINAVLTIREVQGDLPTAGTPASRS